MRRLRIVSSFFLLTLASAAVPVKIFRSSQEAPGAGGQTYDRFIPIGFDEDNTFYFRGPGRGANTSGLWKISPNVNPTPEIVVSQGDAGPIADGVSTFSTFVGTNGIAPDGTVSAFSIIDSGARSILIGSGKPDTFQLALTEVPSSSPLSSSTYHRLERFSLESGGFFAAITKNANSPFAHSIHSGTPGALTVDITDGDLSPSMSPFKSIINHSLTTSRDRSYSFTAELENEKVGLFLKEQGTPIQELLLEGEIAPGGSDLTLEGIRRHSRAPGGYIAIAVLTPDPSPNPGPFPTPVNRMLVGTAGSFTELKVRPFLPNHSSIRGGTFSEITAFDTGAFYNYSYGYFVDDVLKSHRALVRSTGLEAEIEIIAQSNQAAPGFPDGTTFDPTRQFFPITNSRSDGTIAFTARVSDGTTKQLATYISRPGSPLSLIGKFGDDYEFEPEITTTINQIGFGDSLSGFPVSRISPDGSVLYVVTIADPESPGSELFDVYIDYTTLPGGGGGQSYAEWAAANSVGAALSDDDNDGFTNLLEFVLAGDANDSTDTPVLGISPTSIVLTRSTSVKDVILTLEASPDLINWSSDLLTLSETVPGENETEVLTYTFPAEIPILHIRARATLSD